MKKCPDCNGELTYLGDVKFQEEYDVFECKDCGETFDRETGKRVKFDSITRKYVEE